MAVVYFEYKKQTTTDFTWMYTRGLPSLVLLEAQMPQYDSIRLFGNVYGVLFHKMINPWHWIKDLGRIGKNKIYHKQFASCDLVTSGY